MIRWGQRERPDWGARAQDPWAEDRRGGADGRQKVGDKGGRGQLCWGLVVELSKAGGRTGRLLEPGGYQKDAGERLGQGKGSQG